MSKRIISLLCVFALVLASAAFVGCSKFPKTTVSGIEIEEQQYHDSSDNYVFLVMKNKTGNDADVDVTVTFMDAGGKTVDTKTTSVTSFGKGTQVASRVSSSSAFTSCTYTAEVKPATVPSVDKDIKVKVDKKKSGAFISITNNGKIQMSEITYYVLFYKDGNLIDYSSGGCELLINGNTYLDAANTLKPFDDVKVYAHGISVMS